MHKKKIIFILDNVSKEYGISTKYRPMIANKELINHRLDSGTSVLNFKK